MDPGQIVFPPSAREQQTRRGSRALYADRDAPGGFLTEVDQRLVGFLEGVDSFYLATATADGRPYIQHRGGPKGFLRVLGPRRLGFADFAGNRQYITLGRLAENPAVCLFFMDYAQPARIKLWGRAAVKENDPSLMAELATPGYRARPQRAIVIDIDAWDVNCPQHIPRKFDEADVTEAVQALQRHAQALEAENARLRQELEIRAVAD
jgi:uncharacterized protein